MAAGTARHRTPDRGASTAETVARRYLREIVHEREFDAIEELFAHPENWETMSLVGGESVESYAELRDYYRAALPAFEAVTPESIVADGSTAMIRWTATGDVSDGFPGLPVTGTSFETTAMTELGIANGEIVTLHVQVNEMDLLPEVSWPAVRGLVTEMHEGVIVLDDADRIVHVNPAALELFEREREALVGEPVEALLDDGTCTRTLEKVPSNEVHHGQPEHDCAITTTDSGRHVSVGSSPLTDSDGDRLGRMLLMRDVTQQRRRTQGLEVLNRVLRHDLRNALQVVRGRLDMARKRGDQSVASVLQPAEKQVDQLLSTADTARHFEAVFDQQERARVDLTQVGRALVNRARDRYPEASIQASLDEPAVVEAPAPLDDALWQLVENACEHAGDRPDIEVDVEAQDEAVVVTVSDDGPGLPEQERRVLRAGHETDLEHASGIGLWLVQWVIETADGSLEFETDGGTTVQVTLPAAAPGAADRTDVGLTPRQ